VFAPAGWFIGRGGAECEFEEMQDLGVQGPPVRAGTVDESIVKVVGKPEGVTDHDALMAS
jgi:hypothetical protein